MLSGGEFVDIAVGLFRLVCRSHDDQVGRLFCDRRAPATSRPIKTKKPFRNS
jgi:hypothetical protein